MPQKCSTLIQRKHILNQILRSSSEGKLQNDIVETTAELCVAGTRKTPAYPSSSIHHETPKSATRRSNLFQTNRIQPSPTPPYDTHLPTIRYAKNHIDRHNQIHDEHHLRTRSKTPLTNASPKSSGCTPSASISSIYNAFAKRSSENLMSTNGDFEETINATSSPPSRRLQRPNKEHGINQHTTKHIQISQKQTTDSGIDIRFSSSSGDTNQHQRALEGSIRSRRNISQAHIESHHVQEMITKERTNIGQLYQRRPNNAVKAPIKQKIDKSRNRRRSEEIIQAIHEHTSVDPANNTYPTTKYSPSARPKPPPPTPTTSRPTDADNHPHFNGFYYSKNANSSQPIEPIHTYSHQYSPNRVKSPYLYPTHQQIALTTPTGSPPTPLVRMQRNSKPAQPISSTNSSQHHIINAINNRRQPPSTPQHIIKQSTNYSQKNLYLAFIASHHLSTLEDTLLERDTNHRQRLIRIFTWLEDVEDHRHEQCNHDQLILEQDQHTANEEDNLSLYSELQFAVDDLPANTSGQPCEKLATMEFED